ncbi:hypothetical protein J21TS3_33800 [Paenibacillus cookii]|uniref:Uncharacterized protein n=1 Tax=Paenibacillus cookii TaxID=157839 RepID=A0ABQ4LZ57_9BACL|nr:hypothetical protein J21TS3_33800 [Paenibacillus cookii]
MLRCGKWTHEHAGELGVDLIFEYAGADKHDPYFSPLHVEDLDGQLESQYKQAGKQVLLTGACFFVLDLRR